MLKIDVQLLTDFVEFMVENYRMDSASVRWISHGTDAPHSFLNRETGEAELVQDIAEKYAKKNGFEVLSAFDSPFLHQK